jgi:hypothetical protein
MDLLRVVHRPDPQYAADGFREAKYTHLGYATRLSRLYTLDPISISFSKGQPFNNTGSQMEKITK